MPLTLVNGRANTGKTGALFAVVRTVAAQGLVPVLLLPTEPDVTRARNELIHTHRVFSAQVQQLDRYLEALWALWGDGRTLVTPTQRAAIVRACLESDPELAETAIYSGIARVMERLAQAQVRSPHGAPEGPGALFVRGLHRYHQLLEEQSLVETTAAIEVLADRVDSSWFDGPVAVSRFDDLSEAQERFLVSAASKGVDVHIAATELPSTWGGSSGWSLAERLVPHATSVMRVDREYFGSAELAGVSAALSGRGERLAPSGDVVVSEAYGEDAEAERITCEVQEALASGVAAEKVAVIFRHARPHLPSLRRALAEMDIAADFDVMQPFKETAFGRAMMLLIRFSVDRTATALSAFLRGGFSGTDIETAHAIDAMWKRAGACDGARLTRDLRRLDRPVGELVDRVLACAAQSHDVAVAAEWKRVAGTLIANAYGVHTPVLDAIGLADAAAHRCFCRTVDELVRADVPDSSSAELVLGALGHAHAPPLVVERPGRVQVMDAQRARGRRFDVVVVGGLVAGEFPRRVSEDVLAVKEMAASLRRAGVRMPLERTDAAERALFYLAITRARRRLVLSRQVADSDGRTLRASPFLEELLDPYRSADGSLDTALPRRVLTFADLGFHEAAPDSSRRAARSAALARSDDATVRRAFGRRTARQSTIEDPAVRAELERRTVFSVTELERYVRCPYSWFYERFIRPEALSEDREARTRGLLAHEAISRMFAEMRERGQLRATGATSGDWKTLGKQAVQQLAEERLDPSRLSDTLMGRQLASIVERLVDRDIDYLPGFETTNTEWAFGINDEPADLGEFALRGVIDRIDRAGDALAVIDYKTGRVTPLNKFEDAGVLQAQLYADVARRRLGGRVVASFYRSLGARERTALNRGMYDPSAVGGTELVSTDAVDDIDGVIASAVSRARQAADGIRAGEIAPTPLSSDACRYCRAGRWCGEALS